jgi:hypothetical protein
MIGGKNLVHTSVWQGVAVPSPFSMTHRAASPLHQPIQCQANQKSSIGMTTTGVSRAVTRLVDQSTEHETSAEDLEPQHHQVQQHDNPHSESPKASFRALFCARITLVARP